tara:strand:- start:166 stop:477 length:312 start_codon:yes stop_codon:yes gene_type:complete
MSVGIKADEILDAVEKTTLELNLDIVVLGECQSAVFQLKESTDSLEMDEVKDVIFETLEVHGLAWINGTETKNHEAIDAYASAVKDGMSEHYEDVPAVPAYDS